MTEEDFCLAKVHFVSSIWDDPERGVNKETENTNNNVLDFGKMLRSLSRRLVLHFPVSKYCLSLIIIIVV